MRFKPLGKQVFTVKIDNIDITETLNLNIDSLRWREILNGASEADFTLGLSYDNVNKPNSGETIEILFNDRRKFYGYITSISNSPEPEGISIHAEGEYHNFNKETVNFYIGRKPDKSITEIYYTTYKQALNSLGWDLEIGDFVPITESYIKADKADTITRIIQNCGSFAWYLDANGNKKLWKGGKGSIINLERQTLGENLGLFQIINHNIKEDETSKENRADRIKVVMGDRIRPGYDNSWYAFYMNTYFREKRQDDEKIYKESYITSAGWRNIPEQASDTYENYIEIGLADGWRATIPAGYIYSSWRGGWIYIRGTFKEFEEAEENINHIYQSLDWFAKGALHPEERHEEIFYVGSPEGSGIVTKILDLSHLNQQFSRNYKDWNKISTSYSYQEIIPYTVTVLGVARHLFPPNVIIPGWNDIPYATDLANWELTKCKDTKITGNLNITFDCAEFYGLNLSKRIKCDGILDSPINITSIDYNVGSYLVTINVESFNYFKRTVSIPLHEKVRTT